MCASDHRENMLRRMMRGPRLGATVLSLAAMLVAIDVCPAARGSTLLRAQMEGPRRMDWALETARIDESLTGTLVSLTIRNVAKRASRTTGFYAEYLDQVGSVCFTALLNASRNHEKRTGAFRAGEARTLYSLTAYLYPAVKPVSVRVWNLTSGPPPQGGMSGPGSPRIEVPPVLKPTSLTGEDWWVWLGPDVADRERGPITDLLLARVEAGVDGSVVNVTIERSVDDAVSDWFLNFIRHREFRQAQLGGRNRRASTLVLVRSVVSLRCLRQEFVPPYSSPLLSGYLRALSGHAVPPLTVILLWPSSHDYWNQHDPHPAYFTDLGIGAGWTNATTEGKGGQISAQGPVLRKVKAPPGAEGCP